MLHPSGGARWRGSWRSARSRRRLLVSSALVALLAPHVWVVAAGEERFPLTSAAMFTYPVNEETPRYAMQLTAELPAAAAEPVAIGSHQQIDFATTRTNPRHLFSQTWGSVSPASYHRHYEGDGPEAFAARMGAWLAAFHRTLQAQHPDEAPPAALTLWLQPVHPELQTPRPIVRFEAATGAVTLHPEQTWPGLGEQAS